VPVAQNTGMVAIAPNETAQAAAKRTPDYEQPLNERMRTFMRLEFLYQQLLYNCDVDSNWATRGAISSLLEIMAILTRGDVRSEVHKELDLTLADSAPCSEISSPAARKWMPSAHNTCRH
jgi:hypothetical protein